MRKADIFLAVTRGVASLVILAMLADGAFKTDAGTALAAIVALTTSVGSAHAVIHSRTCEGHDPHPPGS